MDDSIDLHTFLPAECGDIVDEFVRDAHERGLSVVRIIHGKGIGNLRRTVHAVLDRHPAVSRYEQAEVNWGATIVALKPRDVTS